MSAPLHGAGRTSPPAPSDARSRPGGGLLHPAALLAIGLLLLNDHVLKGWGPAIVTGKLSDLAGLAFFPLLLQALHEVIEGRVGRFRGPSDRVLGACVLGTGIAFAAVELCPSVDGAHRLALGVLRWPAQALVGLATSEGTWPPLRPAAAWPDPTDLLALPALVVALSVGRARRRSNCG